MYCLFVNVVRDIGLRLFAVCFVSVICCCLFVLGVCFLWYGRVGVCCVCCVVGVWFRDVFVVCFCVVFVIVLLL